MPPAAKATAASAPVALICGDDEFNVKQRARKLYQDWCAEVGGMDDETVDAGAANSSEALKAIARLREALQSLPMFGTGKVVWFRNCSFLGDDSTAESKAVTAAVNELAQELKAFRWEGVRLVISALKVDRRKSFYKTVEKFAAVEHFAALSLDSKGWADEAERFVLQELRARKKKMGHEALATLVNRVGPNLRSLVMEVEKLSIYAGEREEITVADIELVVSRQKQATAFAVGEAVGDRDLPRALRALDEELWAMKADKARSVIGLLYGLISKVRALLFVKEMLRAGWLKPDMGTDRIKTALERIPADVFPTDRKLNPAAIHPFVLYKCIPQTAHYTLEELVRGMDLLLQANLRMVTTGADETLVLQQTLVEIMGTAKPKRAAGGGALNHRAAR